MKYQISNTVSNPQWVDNYVLHHHVTPVHNQLKAAGELDSFYNQVPAERNKMWVQMARAAGICDISLEDDQVWVDIPDNEDTLVWMLKA
jgi:hypothetical protein